MPKELRIRLEQRTPYGRMPTMKDYKVFDATTGEEIQNVLRLTLECDATEQMPTVTLVLDGQVELDGVDNVYANVEGEERG